MSLGPPTPATPVGGGIWLLPAQVKPPSLRDKVGGVPRPSAESFMDHDLVEVEWVDRDVRLAAAGVRYFNNDKSRRRKRGAFARNGEIRCTRPPRIVGHIGRSATDGPPRAAARGRSILSPR